MEILMGVVALIQNFVLLFRKEGRMRMSSIVRFGVSMDKELVDALDELTRVYQFPNRSQTIRHIVHEQIRVLGENDDDAEVTAVISLLYKSGTTLERVPVSSYPSLRIQTNLQSHISHDIVLKILVVTGVALEVRQWASRVMKNPRVVGKVSIVALDSMVEDLAW